MLKKIQFGKLEPNTSSEKTVIGQSAMVVGNIVSQDLVQLKGHVLGNIDVNGGPNAQLAVFPKAHIEGDINAQQAVVNGVVIGNIESTGRIELHSGAEVKGDISYATIAIEHGAKLYGMMTSHIDKEPTSSID